jgi:bromodomain adjacent to zinc finger domain protein 1A
LRSTVPKSKRKCTFTALPSVSDVAFSMEEIKNLTEGQKKDANTKESPNGSTNGNGNEGDRDVEMQESSELSDGGPDSGAASEAGSAAGGTKRSASKGQSLRRKAQAKSREITRSNTASTRKVAADLRRLEEEVNKVDRRLEVIEREFRHRLGCIRVKPMGKDRFHNRIWWFDGLGAGVLVAGGGGAVWGAGRLFIQGPSELDQGLLDKKEAEDGDVKKRRLEEEGVEGMLGVNEWAVYSDAEQVEELVAWLNTKGIRENALKNNMAKWMFHITRGIRKRLTVSFCFPRPPCLS